MSLLWEVSCSDPGNTVYGHFHTQSEVLEFCGKLLYGDLGFLFEVARLDIRLMEPGEVPRLGDGHNPPPGTNPQWSIRARTPDGTVSSRFLDTTHELFGMLIADLKARCNRRRGLQS